MVAYAFILENELNDDKTFAGNARIVLRFDVSDFETGYKKISNLVNQLYLADVVKLSERVDVAFSDSKYADKGFYSCERYKVSKLIKDFVK